MQRQTDLPCKGSPARIGRLRVKGYIMEYSNENIRSIVEAQRKFFRSGATLDVEWRTRQLKRLKTQMQLHEKEIIDALATLEYVSHIEEI